MRSRSAPATVAATGAAGPLHMVFENRTHAGELLAQQLAAHAGRDDVVVLALPRGGVPVGFAVAEALEVPLDILPVRKLGVPGHEEYAMGALASGGQPELQADVPRTLRIPKRTVDAVARRALVEIRRREKRYRAGRPKRDVRDRVVILVDDGIATGCTMRAALHAVRREHPRRLVVAVPVAAPEACQALRMEADEVVCLLTPDPFYSVGCWYDDFEQTSDDEVVALLQAAVHGQAPQKG